MTPVGRHGGRATARAGTRDYAYDARKPEIYTSPNRTISWIGLRYGIWNGLEIGNVYVLNGRKGKVLQKIDASRGSGGLPIAKIEWRD